MTQEEKQLLLKDLCARLLYGVMVHFEGWCPEKLVEVNLNEDVYNGLEGIPIPYLRPMSSMTEEEASEMFRLMFPDRNLISVEIEKNGVRFGQTDNDGVFGHVFLFFNKIYSLEQFDWLNKKMFDYRGLIPMGIALEVPEGMYKNE